MGDSSARGMYRLPEPSYGHTMSFFGISGGGRSAEDRFRALTGATLAPKASVGDAVLDGCPIEVKNATSDTLNQVRAVKYIPLVAYHVPTDSWYVVPAPDVVRLVSSKARGQHTENPFESATLSVRNLAPYRVTSEATLADEVRAAIARGEAHPKIRAAMEDVLQASKDLAISAIDEVRKALRDL